MDIILIKKFKELFKSTSEIHLIRSPGRINLLGEHVDYNEGLVLPAAIDKYIYLAIQEREDDQIHLYSLYYKDYYKSTITDFKHSNNLWANYILGVVDQYLKGGKNLKGFNLVFNGDIPQGAGLSSSAALECATAYGLQKINGFELSKMELAKLAQAAENDFVGVNCGLMDQFASLHGRINHLIQFDCQSLDYSYFPFSSSDYVFILFDSQVKHSLASSAYNERREQCEKGVELISENHSEIKSLRPVTPELLDRYVKSREPLIYQRCRFVVDEIRRVQEACQSLLADDFNRLGKLMYETHEGLSQDYEVSCLELDFLVDQVKKNPAVLGARMMGGGFGGCTINLIKKSHVDEVIADTTAAYKKQLGLEMKSYKVTLVDGTHDLGLF
jgi:galactokinase